MLKINYNYKIITSGEYTELYIYHDRTMSRNDNSLVDLIKSWAIFEEDEEKEKNKKNKKIEKEKEEIMIELTEKEKELKNKINKKNNKKNKKNIHRSKIRLRRLINSNLGQYKEMDKFLTLTYPGLKDRDLAVHSFTMFIKKLKYHYGNNFGYIAVMEIQDGSRLEDKTKATNDIHFHTLLFNLPYIPKKTLQIIWGNGIIDIRKIKDYNDVAGYLANYLVEDDSLNLRGKKTYFSSVGLKKPIEILSTDFNDVLECYDKNLKELLFSNSFEGEYVGRVTYAKFKNRKGKKMNE